MLPIAAEFRLSAGMQPNLVAKEPSKTFSDIQNYWAASILTQMSSYYSVAAAINEMGDRFAPKDSAKPNYAVATLPMLKCVKAQQGELESRLLQEVGNLSIVFFYLDLLRYTVISILPFVRGLQSQNNILSRYSHCN